MHIHIIGVSGTAMGSLAGLLRGLGHRVTGSDVAFDPPIGPALCQWGVECFSGYDPEHLRPSPDLVVVGNVCRPDNVEARAAIDGGLDYTHVAGALQRFALAGSSPLVVAGTHGKTTTSSIAAWLLDATGFRPGFLIGGIPGNFSSSFRPVRSSAFLPLALGSTPSAAPLARPPFVIEGDEYDTAFFEKTAKFLHYRAETAIVTSIEHDHIDIYPSFESYLEAFRQFIAGIPESGWIIAHASDPHVVELVRRAARARVAWYAIEGQPTHGQAPHWLAAPAEMNRSGSSFDLFAGGVAAGRFHVPLSGRHNVANATAAIGAVAHAFGANVRDLGHALGRFAGIKRRQELVGRPDGVYVYDDFAHHPTAVAETLLALRARHPKSRLWAVFEPRSATACRRLHQERYPQAFDAADEVVLAPLGRSNLPEGERLDLQRLEAALRAGGRSAQVAASVEAIVERIAVESRPGDVVALLSNGAFGGIHGKVLSRLEARAGQTPPEPLPRSIP